MLFKCLDTGEEKWGHFYLNVENGLWDNKKSGKKGNFNDFRRYFDDSPIELPKMEEVKFEKKEYKVIDFNTIRTFTQALWGLEPELLKYLQEERGLEDKTIKHFKLGANNNQITIPIFDKTETVMNVRRRINPKTQKE